LQDAFDVEAKKYNVYPLDSSFASRADPAIRPSLSRGRTEFVYYPGMVRIPEGSAPDFKNKSWTIAAEVTIPTGGASGVLASIGGRYDGWIGIDFKSQYSGAVCLVSRSERRWRQGQAKRLRRY
jgi:arylsulfatase